MHKPGRICGLITGLFHTTLVGSQLNAGGNLKLNVGGNLNIQASINSQREEFFEHKLGLVTMTTETEKSFKESANLTKFIAGGTSEFNVGGATNLTDYGTGDLRNLYPEELLILEGLNILTKDLADEYFYDKQVALSPAFKALVSIVVGSVIVPGLGLSGLTGFAANTSQLAAAEAEAFASQIIMGALDGAVSGNFKIGDILKDAAFSGATAGLTSGINIPFEKGSSALKNLVPGFGNQQLTLAKLLNGALDGVISAGMSSIVHGTDFGDNLLRNVLRVGVNAAAGAAISEVADTFGHGSTDIVKTLLKATINCGAAQATGGNCAAGALGTIVIDTLGPILERQALKDGLDSESQKKIRNQLEVAAAIVGWLASQGEADNVHTTVNAALLDADNNILPFVALVAIAAVGLLTAADIALTAIDVYQLSNLGLACDAGDTQACGQLHEEIKSKGIELGISLTVGQLVPGDRVGMKLIQMIKKKGDKDLVEAAEKALTENRKPSAPEKTINVDSNGNALIGDWSSGRKLTSPENALGHWKKHSQEFPEFSNASQYVAAAQDFVANPPKTALVKSRGDDVIIYDQLTNTFAVGDKSGAPLTMFRPDPSSHGYATNLEYFNAQ